MVYVNLIKFIDKSIAGLACFLVGFFSQKNKINKENSKKIIFIQLWGIGETILTLPAIWAVRNKFKDSDIYVLSTERNKDVYLNAAIDINILTVKLNPISIIRLMIFRFRKFDIVIDFEEYLNVSSLIAFFIGKQRVGFSHGYRAKLYNEYIEYNDKQHVALTFLDLVKLLEAKYGYNHLIRLKYGLKEKNIVKKIINKIGNQYLIMGLAPGAAESAKSRMWPLERFTELCNLLLKKYNCYLVFIGSEQEETIIKRIIENVKCKNKCINTAGKISVKELFCLIDNVDLLITNDIGPLHIASAQQTKTVALFGPNTPLRFGPYEKNSVAIYKPESCEFSPCINVHLGKVPDCLYPKKSKDYQKCMKAITVENVLGAVEKIIKI